MTTTSPKLKPMKTYGGGRVGLLGSFPKLSSMPRTTFPEIAFAGRSNVGKSTAINTLLGTKKVARVSGTPGRTQLINLFTIEERMIFADLPGYGFAKVPERVKVTWKAMIEGYLGGREHLKLVVVLVDSRHGPQTLDAEMIWGLRQASLPVLVLATKVDKLKRSKRAAALKSLREPLGLTTKSLIPFSSLEGLGTKETWKVLNDVAAGRELEF